MDGPATRLVLCCAVLCLAGAAAEDIGVIPDPEITIVKLHPDQPFAILATDGVWEFVSSQKAVDMVSAVPLAMLALYLFVAPEQLHP